jgi:hypothetical protein
MTKFSEVAHLYFYTQCLLKRFDSPNYYQDEYGKLFQIHNGTSIESIKPILRPLSDITADESDCLWHEAEYLYFESTPNGTLYRKHELSPKTFTYLLKQGFDIFGLIENGEAIDKTKLQ